MHCLTTESCLRNTLVPRGGVTVAAFHEVDPIGRPRDGFDGVACEDVVSFGRHRTDPA